MAVKPASNELIIESSPLYVNNTSSTLEIETLSSSTNDSRGNISGHEQKNEDLSKDAKMEEPKKVTSESSSLSISTIKSSRDNDSSQCKILPSLVVVVYH